MQGSINGFSAGYCLPLFRMKKQLPVDRKILKEAQRHFLEKGYKKTSMEGIALALGISKKTLYTHFAGKQVLLSAVLATVITQLEAKVAAVLKQRQLPFALKWSAATEQLLPYLSRASLDFCAEIRVQESQYWADFLQELTTSIHPHFIQLIEEGKTSGQVSPELAPQLLWNLLCAAVRSLTDFRSYLEDKEVGEKVMNVLPTQLYLQAMQLLGTGLRSKEVGDEFIEG